ncbi:MAG: hypothetical protein KAS66_00835 [Candidatus Omnitrophica bacterium]|nr:hypothetical protein [Candidatus Omnitrophota bacterium]
MSIINDALKKTQLSFKKKKKPPEKKQEEKPADESTSNVYEKLYKKRQDQQNASAPEKGQKTKGTGKKTSTLRSAKKWLKTSATVAVCLIILSGSFFFISRFEPVQDFLRSVKKNSTSARTRIVRKAPKRRTFKPGEFVLSGTSLIDGKRVALINDEIYEVGEIINGKKITSINLNKIELRDNEKIITLRVH